MSYSRLWTLRTRLKPLFSQALPARGCNLVQPAKRLPWQQFPLRTPLAVGASAFAASFVLGSPGSRFALAEESANEIVSKSVAAKTDPERAPENAPPAPTEEDRKLVQVFKRKRGWFLLGLVGQTILLSIWASLVWLPALTVGVAVAVAKGAGPDGLRFALAGLLALYTVPYLPISGPSLAKSDFLGDIILGWFQSAEIWAAEGALRRNRSEQPTLICYHPHGFLTMGAFLMARFFDDVTMLTAPYIKWAAPIFTTVFSMATPNSVRWESVGRATFKKALRDGQDVFIVPGGIQEATLSKKGAQRVFLLRRKGFVKHALEQGYALTPVFGFGETDTYNNVQAGMKWRLKLNEGFLGQPQGLPTIMPYGWPFGPHLPRRDVDWKMVVGPPLQLPRIPKPTREDVAYWHKRYVEEVERLYSAAVQAAGAPDVPLTLL